MGLKSIAIGQINEINLLQNKTSSGYQPAEQSPQNYETVPLAADKQLGANLIANYNRARIEQKFFAPQQDEAKAKDDINGITTETVFEMPVSKGESQESVMLRAYEAIADKAGLSTEPDGGSKKVFVESRLKANTDANGKVSINNPGKNPPADYTGTEWANIRKLNFTPVNDEIKLLKELKSADNFNAGTKAADDILRAMELGERGFFEKLTSGTDASTELAKALNKVKENGGGYDFQQGLLSRLGADKTVQLEKMLSDNGQYNTLVKDALSTAGLTRPDKQDRTGDVRREIAEKSSLDALVRLTSDKYYPMDKNFLIGAGKRAMTKEVGWTTRAGGGAGTGVPVKYNIYHEGTKQIMQTVARNPEASLELLQDAEFVKNATLLENSGKNEDTISQIIRSGTSKEMSEKNGEKVNNALRVIVEVMKNPSGIRGTSESGLRESSETISQRTAITLAEVYIKNIESFSAGTGRSENSDDIFDGDDVRTLLKVIQPYGDVKDAKGKTLSDKMASSTAVEYMRLLAEAESTGDVSYAEKAANLAGSYVDAKNQTNIEQAKEAEARREQLGKAIGIVAELSVFYGIKSDGLMELVADGLGKTAAAISENSMKGNNIDDAIKQNRATLDNQQATNKRSLLKVYEQGAFERINGKRETTAVEKQNAEQFLTDLREYNESLPAEAKILDGNGRLINSSQMSGRQRAAVEDIFSGSPNQARRRLSDRMNAIYDKLKLNTEVQVKN